MSSQPPQHVIDAAIDASTRHIPERCMRSRRGVAIWDPHGWGGVTTGTNHLPYGNTCDGSDACKALCSKRCVHAEQMALMTLRIPCDRARFEMLHVKTVDGELVPSGPPSCWQCSRLLGPMRIEAMWLYHADGWRRYESVEFHALTEQHCGIQLEAS